jgi:hypothetical protein
MSPGELERNGESELVRGARDRAWRGAVGGSGAG